MAKRDMKPRARARVWELEEPAINQTTRRSKIERAKRAIAAGEVAAQAPVGG